MSRKFIPAVAVTTSLSLLLSSTSWAAPVPVVHVPVPVVHVNVPSVHVNTPAVHLNTPATRVKSDLGLKTPAHQSVALARGNELIAKVNATTGHDRRTVTPDTGRDAGGQTGDGISRDWNVSPKQILGLNYQKGLVAKPGIEDSWWNTSSTPQKVLALGCLPCFTVAAAAVYVVTGHTPWTNANGTGGGGSGGGGGLSPGGGGAPGGGGGEGKTADQSNPSNTNQGKDQPSTSTPGSQSASGGDGKGDGGGPDSDSSVPF